MKTLSLLFVLVGLLVTGCRTNSDIGPSELLYKRWHLSQTKRVSDNAWIAYDMDAYYDTEYRPDGTLIYRRNGVSTPSGCCAGNRFERNGAVIQYTDFPSCPTVKCAGYTSATITILTDHLLELQTGEQLVQYIPAN